MCVHVRVRVCVCACLMILLITQVSYEWRKTMFLFYPFSIITTVYYSYKLGNVSVKRESVDMIFLRVLNKYLCSKYYVNACIP